MRHIPLFTLLLVGIGLAQAANGPGIDPIKPVAAQPNEAYYLADGSFNVAAGKEAYFAMMRSFGYPVYPALRTEAFFVCDFLDADFATVGLGGIFWCNIKGSYEDGKDHSNEPGKPKDPYSYFGMEIYLLPNQMLPEHRHLDGDSGLGPKMEAWMVRHGRVTYYSENQVDESWKLIADLPEDERPKGFGEDWFKCTYYAEKVAGDVIPLDSVRGWHFQKAGPQGAIVTEFATYHDHIAFSKPDMAFKNTPAP